MRKVLSLFYKAENDWGSEQGGNDLPKDKDVGSAKYSSWNSDSDPGSILWIYHTTLLLHSTVQVLTVHILTILVCFPNSPTIYPECCL